MNEDSDKPWGVMCQAHGRFDKAAGRYYLSRERFEYELEAIVFAQEISPSHNPIVVKMTWRVEGT